MAETRTRGSQFDGDVKHVIDRHPPFAGTISSARVAQILEHFCKAVSCGSALKTA